jgi:release factor glutamine methyltransferase
LDGYWGDGEKPFCGNFKPNHLHVSVLSISIAINTIVTTSSAATTIAQALDQARAQGLERIDAQMLLLHALGRPSAGRAWLLAHDTDRLTEAEHTQFATLCQRRAALEPVAYLTGHKEFYGLDLQVDARVLDPRADTETLVDWVLELLAALPAPRVVDLGTGSGAIALALQHQRPTAQVLAVDYSADALAVAQANAQRLQLPVRFAQGSWLGALPAPSAVGEVATGAGHLWDAIVSNPPYIAAQDPHLAALVHEPLQALASGADGLDDIRTIVSQAPAHLAPGGWLLMEHGWDQAEAVAQLLRDAGFVQIGTRNDLAGLGRCTGGQWHPAQTVK